MVKSRIEETEEEFDARMAAISSEAKNANKPQAKPIESSKEVFGALFSASPKRTNSSMKHLTKPTRAIHFMVLAFLMMIGSQTSAATNAETIQYIFDKHEAECIA